MGFGRLLTRLPEPLKDAIKERAWPRPLAEGEQVPEWHLQAHDRTWHRQGPQWSVMHFLPSDREDPRIGQALQDLETHRAALAALKVEVWAILTEEEEALQGMARAHNLGFPLLTDRGASVSRLFRAAIQLPLRPLVLPTLYLVNPQKKVRLANRGYPSVEAVVRSVTALQQAARGGM